MSNKRNAARYIREIARQDNVKVHVCKVNSVDGNTCSATPIIGGAQITNIRLNTSINDDKGIVITPKKDSAIIVVEFNPPDSFVAMYSDIEQISVKSGNSEIIVNNESVIINGGNNNGLVKVQPLISWMNNVFADLTFIQGVINGLGITWMPQTNLAVQQNFENIKVKH